MVCYVKCLVEIPSTKRYSLPLAPESVRPKASPPLILETSKLLFFTYTKEIVTLFILFLIYLEPTKDAPSKFAPQNMAFVPEQIISSRAVAPFA